MTRLRSDAPPLGSAEQRCAFCNKPMRWERGRETLALSRDRALLRFCSRNCLESYVEIELAPAKMARA